MNSTHKWFLITAFVMLGLPFLTVTFAKHDAGMAICFLLFFAVDPLYAAIVGVFAGKDAKRAWYQPFLTSAFFLAGTWLCFDEKETAFLSYAAAYLLLGLLAMGITALIARLKA